MRSARPSLIYNGLYPLLIGFNSIPKVAVVPILVIWFGIGTAGGHPRS
jgi:NitT/TauT family transport system permease protein